MDSMTRTFPGDEAAVQQTPVTKHIELSAKHSTYKQIELFEAGRHHRGLGLETETHISQVLS